MGVKFKDIVSPEEINLKDLEGLIGINTTDSSKNFLGFRVGNNANYELLIDDITIE